MSAQTFIQGALDAGRLTLAHIEALTRFYQHANAIIEDGMPGPLTLAEVVKEFPALFAPVIKLDPRDAKPFLSNPLPLLKPVGRPTVRKAYITSRFHTHEPGRPTHMGVDFFYDWEVGDEPKFVGDGGGAGTNASGQPRWVVPYGTSAVAAAPGVVQIAGPSPTGYRCWIDHGSGLRSGYFHLEQLYVASGEKVSKGTAIGLVGHNPKDNDARHLHFEVSPVDKYEPLDPERYLLP